MIEKEATPLEMWMLIRKIKKGAIVEFQNFVNEPGGKRQVWRTKVLWRGLIYVCYHQIPFSFMITEKGEFINSRDAAKFLGREFDQS